MSGRDAGRIFRGPTSRAIAAAVREALVQHASPAQAVASCPQCGGPLHFGTDAPSGQTLEHCDQCGRRAVVPRRIAEPLPERAAVPGQLRMCARCGAELPNGRVGTRRARFCRDRRACLLAAEGRTPAATAAKLEDAQVLAVLPRSMDSARRLRDLADEFRDFSTEQVRRVLVRLVHRGHVRTTVRPVRRPQGGRAPLRYWRAA